MVAAAIAPPDQRHSWLVRHRVDLLIAAGLAIIAFLMRRHSLPTDGLWLDDAVQAAGLTASPSDLFAVSEDHPGFTALLIGWRALGGGSDAALTYPVLAAGVLGPAVLYLALRYCDYERSIGVLLGTALAVAPTVVVYSGRVKTYVIDILVVLALTLLIPWLTGIRWRWWTGAAWIAAAALVAFWSLFGLIAMAVAGVIVVLHPASDLKVRAPAVAGQAATSALFLFAEERARDVGGVQDMFRETWDAFIDFNNPIQFAGDTFVHFRRVGEYFLGGPPWFAGLCIVLTVLGLAVTAWQGGQAIRARYLLLLLLLAFIGGVVGKLPFGPRELGGGGRVSLWLIPVVAIGLAAALHGLRAILSGPLPKAAFDAAAWIAAAVIIAAGLSRDTVPYPFAGAHSATAFIQSQLTGGDAVLIGYLSDWSYATESGLRSGIHRTPDTTVGFAPSFDDVRVHPVFTSVDPEYVAPEVSEAKRVFVYYAEPPYNGFDQHLRSRLASTLGALGFRPRPARGFDDATVEIWKRSST
jgi:hypothetical protein